MEILTQIRPVDIRSFNNHRASRDQTNGSRSCTNLHGVEMKVMGFLTSLRVSYCDDSPKLSPGASRNSPTERARRGSFAKAPSEPTVGSISVGGLALLKKPTSSIGTPNVLHASAFTRGSDLPRNP
jgi:hypothetical protein